MKLYSALVGVLAALALAPAAQAFTVSNFKVKDRGSRMHYYVTVCGASGYRVLFHEYLHTDMGIGNPFTGNWSELQHQSCSRWDLSEKDQYREGQWDAPLRVVVRGVPKYTAVRYFEVT